MFKKRLGVILLTALVFYLIGANLQAGWLFLLSFSLINLVFIDLLFSLGGKSEIIFERNVPLLAHDEEKIRVKLKVKNPGRDRRLLVVEDTFLGGYKETVFLLKRNQEIQLEKEVTAKRGVYEGGEVRYYTAFPLHFFEFKRKVFVHSTLKVYPSFPFLTNFPLLEGGSFPKEAIHDWRKGSGTEFFGLREYRPGDSYRSIYWKKTAALGKLVVKEFEKLISTKTLLLIDNTNTAYSNSEAGKWAFEQTVKAVASVAEYSLHCGHPVEMAWFEKENPKYCHNLNFKEVLEILAAIDLVKENFKNLLSFLDSEVVHQKTVVLFITPKTHIDFENLKSFQKARSRVFVFSQEAHLKKENKSWEEKIARLEQNNFFICRYQKGEISKCLQKFWKPTAA